MSKKQTYQNRLIAGLLARGWFQAAAPKSFKYTEFSKPDRVGKYFVGKMGALRYGKGSTSSMAIGDPSRQGPHYKQILDDGDKKIADPAYVVQETPPPTKLMGEGRTWEDTQH